MRIKSSERTGIPLKYWMTAIVLLLLVELIFGKPVCADALFLLKID